VTRISWSVACTVLNLAAWAFLTPPAGAQRQDPDREFKAAVAQYEAGQYPEAATQLEKLVREVPESFEVHELLGLVYAAQSQNDKANAHLEKAVSPETRFRDGAHQPWQ